MKEQGRNMENISPEENTMVFFVVFEDTTDKVLELLKVTSPQIQEVKLGMVETVGAHKYSMHFPIFFRLSCRLVGAIWLFLVIVTFRPGPLKAVGLLVADITTHSGGNSSLLQN